MINGNVDCIFWITGSGDEISFSDMINVIDHHTKNSGKIFIGTDSNPNGKSCIFATAICLHGSEGQSGGRYFWKRNRVSSSTMPTLFHRILQETEKSVKTALTIHEKFPDALIEIHLDVGKNTRGGTWPYIDSLTGFAKSAGFECKIKPHAWASASIADKHSK